MKLSQAMKNIDEALDQLKRGKATVPHVNALVNLLKADVAHRTLALKILKATNKGPTPELVNSAEG